MIKPQTLKGFRDFLPKEARKRQYVINTIRSVFESYGFEPLETPALEYEEVLLGKYGDEGDKLMYRFEDNGKRKIALRYDQTVPLARVVAQYQNDLPMPFKRYQIQNVWRAENTQKGRFREFLQIDADIVGTSSPLSDAEIIAITIKSLEKLGIKNFKILINDRSVFKDIPLEAISALDKLKKIGEENVSREMVSKGISEEKARDILGKIKSQEPTEIINNCSQILKNLGIDENVLKFEPTLARGLNYYTGLIFEAEIEGYDAGSIAGGGRYDDLIGMFAGRRIPAVGFAFGFDRLMEALEQFDLFPKELSSVKALVMISDNKEKSLEVYKKLREENISCEIYLDEEDKLEKQLKYADKKNIPYSIIVQENSLSLKDMEKREQKEISIDELIKQLNN
ncbi:MAG: histidine--tRNA ligase [Patescibacteria group bacterium]